MCCSCRARIVGSVRIVCVRREPAFDGLPVERLVPVPVVLRRGDDRDHRKSCMSRRSRPSPPATSTGRDDPRSPPGAADAASTARRQRHGHRGGRPAPAHPRSRRGHRRRSSRRGREPRRRTRARTPRRAPSPSSNETSSATPAVRRLGERDGMELGRDLDPAHTAAERLRQQDRRASPAGGDVEHPRAGLEPEPLAEEQQLLPRCRILDLVRRLRDHVVARDHAAII